MKIHLVTSDDSPKGGNDITANCGEVVHKAAVKFWFDLEAADAATLNYLNICGRCYATRKSKGTYLSGIVNGQEAMTEAVSA